MAFRAKEVDGKKGMDEEIFGVFSFDCLIEGMEWNVCLIHSALAACFLVCLWIECLFDALSNF